MAGQIEQIRTFVVVAEQSGFAAAARVLGMSATAVTRQIAELEARLGAQLFVRTTRQVSLTDAGRTYLEDVTPILEMLDKADEAILNRQVGQVGPLRVSAPLSFGIRFLPDVMAQFRILHPGVALDLQLTDRFVDLASEGYDMALRISGPPDDQTTIWRKICAVPRVLVAQPGYLERRGVPAAPADLAAHDCLVYSERRAKTIWALSKGGDTAQVAVTPCFASNSGDLLARLAEAGEGITLLPDFLVAQAVASDRLRPVLPEWAPPPIWLTATFPPYTALPARVEAFTEFVEATVAGNGGILA